MLSQVLDPNTLYSIQKWDAYYRRIKETPNEFRKMRESYKQHLENDILPYLRKFWKIDYNQACNKTYLEIGCGPTFLGNRLAKMGMNVIGLDFSLEALNMASKLFDEASLDATFICCDMSRTPIPSNTCDFIYGGGVLEHVKDTFSVVKELYRVTKLGGQVFNTVPYLSLASLTYRQLWGNAPDLPLLGHLSETIHKRLIGGKHMIYGYEKSFFGSKLKFLFLQAGFRKVEIGLFDLHLELTFIKSRTLKNFIRQLSKIRLFWHMVYINVIK
jgi:ubiquinone/menaquinone biosynthesis C-methylase UbiE